MSLRYSSLADLPHDAMRKLVAAVWPPKPTTPPPAAAKKLYLEELREERERLQLAMLAQLMPYGLDRLFVREYEFHPVRKWRIDLYAPVHRLAIELHGGISDTARGRHLRALGFKHDREKMNAAIECRIRVLEYWPEAIADGSAALQVQRIVQTSAPHPGCPRGLPSSEWSHYCPNCIKCHHQAAA